MKMLVLSSILLLVVFPDSGVSISDDHEVSGSGFALYSCLALGGSCIPKGTAKSFAGGTTTRCFGPRECRDGFTCCAEIPGKKKIRKKRQAVTFKPGRAIQCPSGDNDPKCGIADEWNLEGGLCRKKCKAGVNLAEIEKDDPNGVCPAGNGCKCCFRQRQCKKLRACTAQNGACRDTCLPGETAMEKGCKNGCTCCVPDDLVIVSSNPDCKKNGGRCTKISKDCNAAKGEKDVADQFSCPPSVKGFAKKCCRKDPSSPVAFTCSTEGGKCKKTTKKKPACDASIGQRDMTDKFTCGASKKNKKKLCCLKDCFHWRSDTWFAHGERHLFECEWALCTDGKYSTYGQERSEKCCLDEGNTKYYEEFKVKCDEFANNTEYSQICTNGSWVDQTELDPTCTETSTTRSEENNGENEESRLISEASEEEKQQAEEQNKESDQIEDQNNESNQGDPSKGGKKGKGKWKGKKKVEGKNKVKGKKLVKGKSKGKFVKGSGVKQNGNGGKRVKGKKKVIGQ